MSQNSSSSSDLGSSTEPVEVQDFDPEVFLQTLDLVQNNASSLAHSVPNMSNNQSRALNWCFTTNNYTDDHVATLRALGDSNDVKYLIFGYEVGDNGTPHLQGFVSFTKRLRFSQVTELIPDSHLSVTRQLKNAIEYCKKEGNFVEFGSCPDGPGTRSDLSEFKAFVKNGNVDIRIIREEYSLICAKYPRFVNEYIRDNLPSIPFEHFPLRDWQQRLNHDLLLPPCDRKIIFIVDAAGNKGKTWFAKMYCSMHDNAQLLLPTKKADMAYALQSNLRVLFMDAPRSKQGEYLQYDFLEEIKNGYVMSNKYESYVKRFGPVHVVVNMNETPDMTKLSADRYDIRILN